MSNIRYIVFTCFKANYDIEDWLEGLDRVLNRKEMTLCEAITKSYFIDRKDDEDAVLVSREK